MEIKIDLLQLTYDQILRKIKSIKMDPNLQSLSLLVRRKPSQLRKNKNALSTFNLDIINHDKQVNQIIYKNGEHFKNTPLSIENRKQHDLYNYQNDNLDIVNDKKMLKAKKNYVQGNYDMSINILTEMLQETENSIMNDDYIEGDKQRKIANITFYLANNYFKKRCFDKAIELYNIDIPQENYKHKAMRKSNLGTIYLHLNKNQESLRNFTQALKIYSQCGCEQVDLSNIYHNVGNIYLRQKMYEISSKYFSMAVEERKYKSGDAQLLLFYSVFKLGISQKFQQKHQESLKNLFYAVSFAQRGVGDIIEVYREIAQVYELLGKLNDSLNFYEKICDNPKTTEQEKGYAYEKAATIYIKSQQQSQGIRIMKIAEQCYQKAGNEIKVSHIKQNIRTVSTKI